MGYCLTIPNPARAPMFDSTSQNLPTELETSQGVKVSVNWSWSAHDSSPVRATLLTVSGSSQMEFVEGPWENAEAAIEAVKLAAEQWVHSS